MARDWWVCHSFHSRWLHWRHDIWCGEVKSRAHIHTPTPTPTHTRRIRALKEASNGGVRVIIADPIGSVLADAFARFGGDANPVTATDAAVGTGKRKRYQVRQTGASVARLLLLLFVALFVFFSFAFSPPLFGVVCSSFLAFFVLHLLALLLLPLFPCFPNLKTCFTVLFLLDLNTYACAG